MSDLTDTILWILISLGPTAIAAGLGFRAAFGGRDAAWADFYDAATVLDWLAAPLIVVAAPLLVGSCSPFAATLACVAAVLSSRAPVSLFSPESLPFRGRAKLALASSGGELGISAYLLRCAVSSAGLRGLVPSASLYLDLIWASLIGQWIVSAIFGRYSRCKPLGPGALSDRIQEIAHSRGAKLEEVLVLKSVPGYTDYPNALAAHGTTLVLFAELLAKLDRAEVDAVVEHEIGHIADERLWTIDASIRYGCYLLMLAVAFGAGKAIAALPASWVFLLYAMWIGLFALPELLSRWYSRAAERRADKNVAQLTDPLSAVSADYKLALLNHHPIIRPRWSRLLSTHPCTDERVAGIAARHDSTEHQLREAYDRAKAAVDSPVTDGYDLTPTRPEGTVPDKPAARSRRRTGYRPLMLSAVAGIATMIAMTLGLIATADSFPLAMLTVVVGLVACALAFILPIEISRNRRLKRLRSDIREHLEGRYGGPALEESLLVDALFPEMMDQDQPWQGALLKVSEGKLLLRGETTVLAIPLDREVSISRRADNTAIGADGVTVAICYEDNGTLRAVCIRIVGKPEPNTPQNVKQLERRIKSLLADTGAHTISAKDMVRKHRRSRALRWSRRIPIAAAIYLLILALADHLARDFDGGTLGRVVWCLIATAIAGSGLWAWVTQAFKPGDEPEERDAAGDDSTSRCGEG